MKPYLEPYTFAEYGIVRRIWRVIYPVLIGLLAITIVGGIAAAAFTFKDAFVYGMETAQSGAVADLTAVNEIAAASVQKILDYSIYITIAGYLVGIAALLPIWLITRKYQPQIEHGSTVKSIIFSFLFFPGIALFLNLLLSLLGVEMSEATEESLKAIYESPLWLQFLALAVLAPIFEEIIFRGIILARSLYWMPKWVAVIVSAVLFGIWHMNVSQLVYAIPIGILLAVLYIRYRNIIVCMAAHCACNTASIIITQLSNDESNENLLWIVFGVLLLLTIVTAIPLFTAKLKLINAAKVVFPEETPPYTEPLEG